MPAGKRPRPRRGHLLAESEEALQVKTIQLARFCQWWVYHPPRNRPSAKTGRVVPVLGTVAGWPDLTFVREPEIFFAELKAEDGRVRPDQQLALQRLAACGLEVHIWRPSDWPSIEARLKRPPGKENIDGPGS